MRNAARLLLVIVPLSFVLGTYEGRRLFDKNPLHSQAKLPSQVRILSWQGFITSSLQTSIQNDLGVQIVNKNVSNFKEYREALAGQDAIDLIVYYNWQEKWILPELRKSTSSDEQYFNTISPDFLIKSDSSERALSLPLFWGVTGLLYPSGSKDLSPLSARLWPGLKQKLKLVGSPQDLLYLAFHQSEPVQISQGEAAFVMAKNPGHWKFSIPAEGGVLSVLNIGLTRNSQNSARARDVLEWFLAVENQAHLLAEVYLASTNLRVESLRIDESLKPSYLRKIPLPLVQRKLMEMLNAQDQERWIDDHLQI